MLTFGKAVFRLVIVLFVMSVVAPTVKSTDWHVRAVYSKKFPS